MKEGVDLDGVVDDIEQRIEEQERKKFSAKVLREFKDPKNLGRLDQPDCMASITGPCGDTMEFSMKVRNDKIIEIRFMTDGCGSSIACGSMTTRIAKGRSLEEASRITDKNILDELDGLPEENRHCAKLATNTLGKAIDHYSERER
jgi:nitrogen fixation protein NifU and related proteins